MPVRIGSDCEAAKNIDVELPAANAVTTIEAASVRHEYCVRANGARARCMPTAVSTRLRRLGGGASRVRCWRINRCRASMRSHSAASAGSVDIRFSTASAFTGIELTIEIGMNQQGGPTTSEFACSTATKTRRDAELAEHIRQHIAASRLNGEGYRKL